MVITLAVAVIIYSSFFLYMRQSKFGRLATGERLRRMQQSTHYKDGKFRNLVHTTTLAEGYSMSGVIANRLLKKPTREKPAGPVPSVKTDLLHLPANKNLLVWFGHSSYFLKVDGKTILVDPVFSGNASPLPVPFLRLKDQIFIQLMICPRSTC